MGLTQIMTSWKPQPHLRQKKMIDLSLSDRELFDASDLGDIWGDAKLVEAYRYLRAYKPCTVPVSWQASLEKLDGELDAACPKEN